MGRFKILLLAFLVCITSINCKEYIRVCHVKHSSNNGKEDIDRNLCTHIIHGFNILDKSSGGGGSVSKAGATEASSASDDPGGNGGTEKEEKDDEPQNLESGGTGESEIPYILDLDLAHIEKLVSKKETEKALKILITIENGYPDIFTKIIAESPSRLAFLEKTADLMSKNNIDGMEIEFDYYADGRRTDEERKAFASFVGELKRLYAGSKLMLTASAPIGFFSDELTQEILTMTKDVEFLTIKAFGFNKDSMRRGHNAPLFSPRHEMTVSSVMDRWVKLGAPKGKLLMGIQFRITCYTIDNKTYHINYGRDKDVVDNKCPPTVNNETFSFRKICRIVGNPAARRVWDLEEQVPYLVFGRLWVGFETPLSLVMKVFHARDNYAGWSFWDITMDDSTGHSCENQTFPLLTALNRALDDDYDINQTIQDFPEMTEGGHTDDWPVPPGGYGNDSVSSNEPFDESSCNGKEDGKYPVPDGCRHYIECKGGVAKLRLCKHTLWFDPFFDRCVYAEGLSNRRLAECSRTQNVEELKKMIGRTVTDSPNKPKNATGANIPGRRPGNDTGKDNPNEGENPKDDDPEEDEDDNSQPGDGKGVNGTRSEIGEASKIGSNLLINLAFAFFCFTF